MEDLEKPKTLFIEFLVVVQFMSYVRSEDKVPYTLHIRRNVVSRLVTFCPYQQFVMENCHGTSV